MIASRHDIQSRFWTILASLGLLVPLAFLSSPAVAGPVGVGASVSPSLVTEIATDSLMLQQQTRRRTGTSQPAARPSRGTTRSAPSSSSSSRGTSARRRTNTDTYRGGSSGHRGHGRSGYYRGSRYYSPFYYPYYYSYPFYSSWYWWGPPVYYGYRIAEDYGRAAGALDLDIKPEEAEVWVDGEYVGIADNYDGFPRYLWLPEGEHRLVFYLEGYRTTAREFTIADGVVLQVKTSLDVGETRPAEEFFPKPTARAEARKKADQERRAAWRYEERDRDKAEPKVDEAWRRERTERPGDWRERSDLRGEPARLKLTVTPNDAVIYLDGRLVGSGEELARLHSALLIDVGEHVLEATRPGYESERLEFDADAGEDVELKVDLDEE